MFLKHRQAIIEHNYGNIKRQWSFHFILTNEIQTPGSFGCRFYFYSLQSEKNPEYYGLGGVWDYMKELPTDLKRPVLSLIQAFEIITSGFLSFHRNVLFCNGLRKGYGYLHKLGDRRVFRQTDVSGHPTNNIYRLPIYIYNENQKSILLNYYLYFNTSL